MPKYAFWLLFTTWGAGCLWQRPREPEQELVKKAGAGIQQLLGRESPGGGQPRPTDQLWGRGTYQKMLALQAILSRE